ncbi:MAG: sulfite exporter TauE/SafE family protein, partial [Thermoproteota archaeon]
FAGLLGSMLGVGGGFLIVPLLVLLLDIPMHLAVGISLTSVVMTSVSSSIIYSKENLIDFKLGIFLETATAIGALTGSHIALLVPENILETIFGVVLIYASFRMILSKRIKEEKKTLETLSKKRILLGLGGSFIAGMASGMLGIGGGTLKVPILVLLLGIATKTAIATSAFMIGVTASVASFVYQFHGLTDPLLVAFIIIGIFIGVRVGSHITIKAKSITLRRIFGIILFIFALRMLLKGIGVAV